MRTTTRRALSFVLTLTMLFSMAMPTAFGAEPVAVAEKAYSDIAGHWAEKPIERWDDYGIVSGFGEEFRPNGTITRGQMASILSNLLNLTEEAENTFSDVPEGKWYTTFVLRCVKAGIMAGANGKAMPEKEITRQEAMTMLCQALGIEPKADADLSKYADVDQLANWAKPFVGALVEAGIVSGVSDTKLGSLSSMSRGAVMTVLDKAVAQYINAPGTYELTDKEGIVLVASKDVKLTGETKATVLVSPAVDKDTVTREEEVAVGGGGGFVPSRPSAPVVEDLVVPTAGAVVTGGTYDDVTISDTVGDGEVTLADMTINGDLVINGGGSGTVKLKNCKIKGDVIVEKNNGQPPRVHLEETPVENVIAETPTIIEAVDQKSEVSNVEANDDVTVQGEETTVKTVVIPEHANDNALKVNVKGNSKIEKVKAEGKTEIDASGAESGAIVGEVIAEAPVTVPADVVDKVEVPETVTTKVAIEVTGNGEVAVEVNTENGADIETSANSDVQVSTKLEDVVPEVTVDNVPVEHFHVWDEGIVEPAATCTQAGIKTYTCKADGCTSPAATKVENIAKLNHKEVEDKAVAATCTQTGLTLGYHCEDCGKVTKAQEVVDALGHTEVVDKAVAPTCTETGLTEGKHCSVCNEVLVTQDVVAALGHAEVVDEAKAPTCTETGFTEGKHCSRCNEVLVAQEIVAVLGHDMTESHFDVNGHWNECTRCDEVGEAIAHKYVVNDCSKAEKCSGCEYVKPAGEHSWNDGVVSVEPTCTEVGTRLFTCTADGCGQTKTEEIEALGHTEVIDAAKAPNCEETGLTEGSHCSVCDEVLVAQEVVDALGHTEVIDEAKEPTCTETGLTEGMHCSVCGEVLVAQEGIPTLGHEMTESHYDVNGHWNECTRCDEKSEVVAHKYALNDCSKEEQCNDCDYVKPAGEHNWDDGKVTVEPTCTEVGTRLFTCTADGCGQTKTEDIEALGHTEVIDAAKAPTCTETGLTEGKHCSVCDEVLIAQEVVKELGHSWDEGKVTVEPTLHETGTRTYTCGTCGGTKEEELPVIQLMGKNGYELIVHLGQDLFSEVTAPAGTDPNTRYVFKFYNSYNPNHYDAWGDREADATYGIPNHPGTYDVFQLSIYDGDFEDNEIVAEFFLETPIAVYEDAFELDDVITVTRTPDEKDENLAWYDIEGLNFDEYGYYFAADVNDYPNPMGTPPLGFSKDYCDTTMVIYAGHAYEDTQANLYIKAMSKPYVVTIIDRTLDDVENEELIDAANDIKLLKYITGDIDLDAKITRLEVAQLMAALDNLRLDSNATLDFTDCADLSAQDKAILKANIDAGYLAGRQNGTFGPEDPATRAEVAMILQRIYEINGMDYPVGALDDVVLGNWYYEAVMNMYNLGIIQLDGRMFEPNAYAIVRDVVEWCINAREWDETPHYLGGVTEWKAVRSEYVHAKVCVDCGLWVEKENHKWNGGVISDDGTTLTKQCTVCDFEWTVELPTGIESNGQYPVSAAHFNENVLVWNAPTGVSGEILYVIELSTDGEKWFDVGETEELEEQIRYEVEGNYYIRIMTLQYDSANDEYDHVGTYADYGLKLNVKEGKVLTGADVTFQCQGTEDGHRHEITVSKIPADVDFHLNTYIPGEDQSGWYGGTDETGKAHATLGNRHLHDILVNEESCYQLFTFYGYSLSNDGKTLSYSYDYTEEAMCADAIVENGDDTTSGGIVTTGEYPVQNLHFEGINLVWDAPANVPEDASVRYRIYVSEDGGNTWEKNWGTSHLSNGLIWPNQGTYQIMVASVVNGVENGTVTSEDHTLTIHYGGSDTGADARAVFVKEGTDKYTYTVSGFASATVAYSLQICDANGESFLWEQDFINNNSKTIEETGLEAAMNGGTYCIYQYKEEEVTSGGRALTYFYYSGLDFGINDASESTVVEAPKGILSMQQTGMSIKIGMDAPTDMSNIDYFTLTVYEAEKKDASMMTGITCSKDHPYFYLSREKFNSDYLYDTVEITAIANAGYTNAVWTDTIYLHQNWEWPEATYSYNVNNEPAPLLTVDFNTSAPGFYHIGVWNNDQLIENSSAYNNASDDGMSVCRSVTTEEAIAIASGSATIQLEGWIVTELTQVDGVWKIAFTNYDEIICEQKEETPQEGVITFTKSENEIKASWTGFAATRYAYCVRNQDDKRESLYIWLSEGETTSFDLAQTLPRLAEGTGTYDFVLYEIKNNTVGEELGRIKDAIVVTVDGTAVDYNMAFNYDTYTSGNYVAQKNKVTWNSMPTGIWQINAWYRNGAIDRCGAGSITSELEFTTQIQEGDVFDLRVVTAYELDGQTLKATITPESKKTYTVETGELVDQKNGYDVRWYIQQGMIYTELTAPEGSDTEARYTLYLYSTDSDKYTYTTYLSTTYNSDFGVSPGEYNRVRLYANSDNYDFESQTPLADWALDKKVVSTKNVGDIAEAGAITATSTKKAYENGTEYFEIVLSGDALDFSKYTYELYNAEKRYSTRFTTNSTTDRTGYFNGEGLTLYRYSAEETDTTINLYKSNAYTIDVVLVE